MSIRLKTPKEIEAMQEGGNILAAILRELMTMVKPGAVIRTFDTKARELMKKENVELSFPTAGFPHAVCLSTNNEAVHGTPSDRVLKEGDLFKIDIGIIHKKLHTDMAATVLVSSVGKIGRFFRREYAQQRKLVSVTHDALMAGIACARVGQRVCDIGAAVQQVVEQQGFTVLKELGGHGIGQELHEEPFVPNFYEPEYNEPLRAGMALAIEPIVAVGTEDIKDGPDGFAYLTKNGSLSAHFEHTIIVTETKPIIVTV